jgi:hypothetical protein
MRQSLIVVLSLVSLTGFAQTKSKIAEPLFGVYEYKRQEAKDMYAIIKITLNKDQTYSYHSSSPTLKTNSDDSGKWSRNKDTLFLTNKEETVERYLISGKTICDLSEPEGQSCLQKIK